LEYLCNHIPRAHRDVKYNPESLCSWKCCTEAVGTWWASTQSLEIFNKTSWRSNFSE